MLTTNGAAIALIQYCLGGKLASRESRGSTKVLTTNGAIAFLPFGDFAIHLILKPIHYYSIKSDRTP
ncbi:MAG: hypothetical protein ACOC07_13740 [Coleofasciculus sp.]|uniref:hypothetical protein n=1 Tax=Coleofasciculus sp. TaxID=3100458 RepID=UPI003A42E031